MTYLTFDIGTTGLKTALISAEGRLLAVHTAEYALRTPRPDWVELPPETYWEAACAGTKAVFAQVAGTEAADPAELTAIGFSSQGQSFIPLDRAGKPLHDAIVWLDNRAQAIAEEWEASWLSRGRYQEITGYPWIPAEMTPFKLAWLAREDPAAHAAWKFLLLPDYLIWRLTGETATDYNQAQMCGMYDMRAQHWDADILAAAGVGPEQLSTVHAPGTQVGHLRPEPARELGLPAGVAVCVGANDQTCGALGAGNVGPGVVTETTGTALALAATLPELWEGMNFYVGVHAVPGLAYALTFSNTSAIVLTWLRDLNAPGMRYTSFLEGVESVPVGCEGLAMIPHFTGSGTPTYNRRARGVFAGLTLHHERRHLARAIMEACACLLQECLAPITAQGLEVNAVRSLGGAARSDLWLQMKADLLGLPVERPACSDAASLGAAMLAAVGTGQFASLPEAAAAWYRPAHRFEPTAAGHQAYQQVYERYHELYARLYGG